MAAVKAAWKHWLNKSALAGLSPSPQTTFKRGFGGLFMCLYIRQLNIELKLRAHDKGCLKSTMVIAEILFCQDVVAGIVYLSQSSLNLG